ncbi:polysaccharide lyase beta-sandwich domain-containing protein [Plantactinospora sp. KLBMP9567]|uniref:polysaccharide lyase beta-sandwich domain-containing protein n=1 Tax=Plantactinospora sp. KLBMP9567 TaxID=3085900 RepID=UPI00298181F1|nr:polysaccharide lyase beta-sandwich domain-containing protein [Plantactinospora sp. KLBMP9567]MDW5322370.1 polysaccharide lyase beta-sandwich domain-containing protein [Plantactinospora sp. KLBMP9567]
MTMANFWSVGSVGGITVSRVSAVVVREYADPLTICVAEPYRRRLPAARLRTSAWR